MPPNDRINGFVYQGLPPDHPALFVPVAIQGPASSPQTGLSLFTLSPAERAKFARLTAATVSQAPRLWGQVGTSITAPTPVFGFTEHHKLTPLLEISNMPSPLGPHDVLPLSELIALISASMRVQARAGAEALPTHDYTALLRGENLGSLVAQIREHHPRLVPYARLEDVLYQSGDRHRGVVELVSNALDASDGDVTIRVADGYFAVEDFGTGMSPKIIAERLLIPKLSGKPDEGLQTGRFGIGFYTALRYLVDEDKMAAGHTLAASLIPGAHVVVETKTQEYGAWRIVYGVKDGNIAVKTEALPDNPGPTGTRIQVYSPTIKQKQVQKEVYTWLRHVDPARGLYLNGQRVNPEGTTFLLHENQQRGTKVFWHAGFHGSRITIKGGKNLIVEQYDVAGHGILGELVLELPYGVGLSETRDAVEVDDAIWQAFAETLNLVDQDTLFPTLRTKIGFLNMLARLAQEFEKSGRNHVQDPQITEPNFGKLVRKKVLGVVGNQLVYPDLPGIREAMGDAALYVDPCIYSKQLYDNFTTPKEFGGGQILHASGKKTPLQLLLSPHLQGTYYAEETGVLYLGQATYEQSDPVVLQALALIPHLAYRYRWQTKEARHAVAAQTTGENDTEWQPRAGNELLRGLRGSPTSLRALDHLFGELGLTLRDLLPTSRRQYSRFNFHPHGDRLWVAAQDKFGKWVVFDLAAPDRPVVEFKYEYLTLHPQGDRLWVRAQNEDGKCGVFDLAAPDRPVLEFKYRDLSLHSQGDRLWVSTQNKDGKYGVFDLAAPDRPVVEFKYEYLTLHPQGDRLWVAAVNQNGKWVVFDLAAPDQPVVELKYGKELFLYPHGDRVWVAVEDRNGKWGLFDLAAPDRPVVKFKYEYLFLYPHGDQVWVAAVKQYSKWDVFDLLAPDQPVVKLKRRGDLSFHSHGDRLWVKVTNWMRVEDDKEKNHWCSVVDLAARDRPELQLKYRELSLHPHGDRLWVAAQDGNWKWDWDVFDLAAPDQLARNPREPLLTGVKYPYISPHGEYMTWHKDGQTFFYDALQLSHLLDPSTQERLRDLHAWRLVSPAAMHTLFRVAAKTWEAIKTHDNKDWLVTELAHPGKEALFMADEGASISKLETVFAFVDAFDSHGLANQPVFLERLRRLLVSPVDLNQIFADLRAGRQTDDIRAIRRYFTTAVLLVAGRDQLAPVTAPTHRLASLIAQVRQYGHLDNSIAVADTTSEIDQRDLLAAIHHLNLSHRFIFLRELLQNSLDIQGAIPNADDHKIEVEVYEVEGHLQISFRDYGGMTTKTFYEHLLNPENGHKQDQQELRGQFGVGFYSLFREAAWVRIKTAIKGSATCMVADFTVERDGKGKITDVVARVVEESNAEGFYGTHIESRRTSGNALLDGAYVTEMIEDMGQYMSEDQAAFFWNGKKLSQARTPLVEHTIPGLGAVQVYDGAKRRILLGGLPFGDFPDTLWEDVPEVIRGFYDREGFYINLDHRLVKPTRTRDRFRQQEFVYAQLKQHLPGMLLQGFLVRVMQADKPEDLNFLPPNLFADMNLNLTRLSMMTNFTDILRDVALLSVGKFGDIAYDQYRGRDGLKNLQYLILNLPLWPNPENQDEKVSLVDLLESPPIFLTKNAADTWQASLPRAVRQMILVAQQYEDIATLTAIRAELGTDAARHQPVSKQLWPSTAFNGTFFETYFKLMQEIISLYYNTEPVEFVVSNHPSIMQTMAAAARFVGRATVLFPVNYFWLKRVTGLYTILITEQDEEEKLAALRAWLAVELEVITHELTHFVRKDVPDESGRTSEDLLHPEQFYRDHAQLLTTSKKPVRAPELLNKVRPVIKDHTNLVAAPTIVNPMEILQATAPMDLSAAAVNKGDETKLETDGPPEPDPMDDALDADFDPYDITAGSHITGGVTLMMGTPALRSPMIRPVTLLGL